MLSINPCIETQKTGVGDFLSFVICSSSQYGYIEKKNLFSMLLCHLFNWLIEDSWPSLAHQSCQRPSSDPTTPVTGEVEKMKLKLLRQEREEHLHAAEGRVR